MTDWCILRTGSLRTIRLAAELRELGFDAWTPVEITDKPWPRSSIKREVIIPMTPCYVFAAYDQLDDLLKLSHSPGALHMRWCPDERRMISHGVPHFTVFLSEGRAPRVPEAVIAPLRAHEAEQNAETMQAREKAARLLAEKGPIPRFAAGDTVHVGGAYAGLDLIVVAANTGKQVKVTCKDWLWTTKISAFQAEPVHVEDGNPEQGADRIGMVS